MQDGDFSAGKNRNISAMSHQASSWHEARRGICLVLILAFLKKRLIEKIIPRRNWENAMENTKESISGPLDFKIFWAGMPQTPLAARAFGARNLPRLVLKSGYSPALPAEKRSPKYHTKNSSDIDLVTEDNVTFSDCFTVDTLLQSDIRALCF